LNTNTTNFLSMYLYSFLKRVRDLCCQTTLMHTYVHTVKVQVKLSLCLTK
jgi:hypothetical protein